MCIPHKSRCQNGSAYRPHATHYLHLVASPEQNKAKYAAQRDKARIMSVIIGRCRHATSGCLELRREGQPRLTRKLSSFLR
jgi:hypothetical protein